MLKFYDHLTQDTEGDRTAFQSISVIRQAIETGVTLPLYLDFLSNAYHHVKFTCPLLGLALSRLNAGDEEYRTGLLDYLAEEKGHEDWILDDIRALGGDQAAVAVKIGQASLPVRLMVAYGYYAIEHISPYALLGMVHVLEGMSVALAQGAAQSICSSLKLSPGCDGFSYLTSHGALDKTHVQSFVQLLDLVDTPDRRRVVIQAAKDFYHLYGNIFHSLSAEPEYPDVA